MSRLLKIGAIGALVGWLHSIGALDPRLWIDTLKREKARIPAQLKEALAAGRRAAAEAEAKLQREIEDSFDGGSGGR